jgi:hypothetical protein
MLCGAMKGPYEGTEVGVFFSDMAIREVNGRDQAGNRYPYKAALSELAPSIDSAKWTAYELQFKGTKIRFVVNGTLLAERDRDPTRDSGKAGLLIQDVHVEVRRIQVIQR